MTEVIFNNNKIKTCYFRKFFKLKMLLTKNQILTRHSMNQYNNLNVLPSEINSIDRILINFQSNFPAALRIPYKRKMQPKANHNTPSTLGCTCS